MSTSTERTSWLFPIAAVSSILFAGLSGAVFLSPRILAESLGVRTPTFIVAWSFWGATAGVLGCLAVAWRWRNPSSSFVRGPISKLPAMAFAVFVVVVASTLLGIPGRIVLSIVANDCEEGVRAGYARNACTTAAEFHSMLKPDNLERTIEFKRRACELGDERLCAEVQR